MRLVLNNLIETMSFTNTTRGQATCREWFVLSVFLYGCGEIDKSTDTATDNSDTLEDTAISEVDEPSCDPILYEPNPFITEVVDVQYGEGAGFGQESFPNIVFGAPMGGGENRGSLDVLTLGEGGSITVGFDVGIQDGEGPDLIVFENAFVGWLETGIVSASIDGETWFGWDCDFIDADNGFPGCAGATPTLSHPDNCIDARDYELAGGDAFDLAEIGLTEARFIRIEDSGANTLGGFDLDAIVVIHTKSLTEEQ